MNEDNLCLVMSHKLKWGAHHYGGELISIIDSRLIANDKSRLKKIPQGLPLGEHLTRQLESPKKLVLYIISAHYRHKYESLFTSS